MFRMPALAASCACCLLLTACNGDGVVPVSGTVTMDGQPLADAIVTFVPASGGRAATGRTDASGKYELVFVDGKGAPAGQYKVSITSAPDAAAGTSDQPMSDAEYEQAAQAAMSGQAYDEATVSEPIPARYNSATELTAEVTSGATEIDFELTSG